MRLEANQVARVVQERDPQSPRPKSTVQALTTPDNYLTENLLDIIPRSSFRSVFVPLSLLSNGGQEHVTHLLREVRSS